MATPLEQAAEAIHRTHHNDETGTCVGYWPEDMTTATAAIEALREGAVDRVQRMHANKYGAGCSVMEAEGFIDAVLGPPKEGE